MSTTTEPKALRGIANASAPRALHRWQVGARYSCSLVATGKPPRLSIEWSPERPASLSVAERREYRRHRDLGLDRAARALGMRVADLAAQLDADPDQPMADRAAGAKDDRGHWNADR